jgi:hypothetical protein
MNASENQDRRLVQPKKGASALKEKAVEELKEFWAIALYLSVMFAAFTWYGRLMLAQSGISYFHYGAAIVKALVLAKVIMVGQALGLARQFERPPLIRSVLFKSVVYGVFFALFTVLEHLIEGLLRHEALGDVLRSLVSAGRDTLLARTIMVMVTFIPFFAFLETDRVMGERKMFRLFFHREAAQEPTLP